MPTPGSCGGKAALINVGGQRTNLQAAGSFSELYDFGGQMLFPPFCFILNFSHLSVYPYIIYIYIHTYIFYKCINWVIS